MVTVVCWKWKPEQGSKHPEKRAAFSVEHVNRLFRMLGRNLTRTFRLVCVTDDWKGLDSSITVVNINRHFAQYSELGGCYRRLKAFDLTTALALFGSSFVSIDLDVVITGNLDSLLKWKGFRVWEDTYRRFCPYCGSLWGMQAGARESVWQSFNAHPERDIAAARDRRYIGTDQAIISAHLHPNEQVWTKADGVYNFNTQVRECPSGVVRRRGVLTNIPGRTGELPGNAKMVFFNGKYDPSQAALQKQYDWIGDLWR